MFVFFKHCIYIAKGRIRNSGTSHQRRQNAIAKRPRTPTTTTNKQQSGSQFTCRASSCKNNKEENLGKIVTLSTDKNLGKIVKSVRHESANQERQRPNNWPNSHETSWP